MVKNYSNNKSGARNSRHPATSDGFLEALRDLGSGFVDSVAHDVVGGVAQQAYNQITGKNGGELKPNQTIDFQELRQREEEQKSRNFRQDFLDLRRQEKLIWSQQEQQTKLQISAILQELKKLALATKNLAKEVDVAANQVPVEPGVYHINFFEKLRETIILFKKKIEESATWLSACNQRAKKRNYYWGQVRKSGTKFMLSHERYMATQTG